MRIAIIGTRGIPNHYGGFEECATHLAQRWVSMGHEVSVYNSANHPIPAAPLKGMIGTIGQCVQ